MLIENKRYPAKTWRPGPESDVLHLCGEHEYHFRNCIFEGPYDAEYDEVVGITHGASAIFERCYFGSGAKLVLIGSGDEEYRSVEEGKRVVFSECMFSYFDRRGPEVQSGMQCIMERCLVQNWGNLEGNFVRVFGTWVHDGGKLDINHCLFFQHSDMFKKPLKYRIKDRLNHIGQAVNDGGILALFKLRTYLSGWCRGCTADRDGKIVMHKCWANDERIVLDGNDEMMTDYDAFELVMWHRNYFDALRAKTKRAERCV